MCKIKSNEIYKECVIDLISQKVKIKNALAKTFKQIDKLIKRDWQYMRLHKSEKKSLQDRLAGYVKTGKKNKNY